MLLETAEVNIEANNGLFPFHEAAREGRTAIVQLLMVKGAEIQVRTKKRETPLLLAAREGQNETVQLLDNGADGNMEDKDGDGPLKFASCGYLTIVRALLDTEVEVDINATTKSGFTPLNGAANEGNAEIVQLLLDRGADANIKTREGSVPLHSAAFGGYESIVLLHLDNSAEVGVKDHAGLTQLHDAAREGHTTTVQLLLNRSADLTITTKKRSGQTPEDLASACGHELVAELLRAEATRRARYEAFAMGEHPWLGATSSVARLDPGVVRLILDRV